MVASNCTSEGFMAMADDQRALACGLKYLITDATLHAFGNSPRQASVAGFRHNQQKNHRRLLRRDPLPQPLAHQASGGRA